MLDRRRLFTGLGGIAAAFAGRPLLASGGVDVTACLDACNCNPTVKPGPEPKTPIDYDWPPRVSAVETVRANFITGLAEVATGNQVTAFMADLELKYIFEKCYETEIKRKVHDNEFDPNNSDRKAEWITLNDHAYILGQLTGTMVRKKKDGTWKAPDIKSFLRAKSKFAEAISKARCQCFIDKGAYKLPPRLKGSSVVGQIRELDKDCCLC